MEKVMSEIFVAVLSVAAAELARQIAIKSNLKIKE